MHVLFGLSTFSTLSDPRMGSEVAAATMARYLARRQRIKVTMANILWTGFEPDQFDLVHLWNAGGHKGPYALAARLARAAGRPLLMTPIYWPYGPGDEQAAREGMGASREDVDVFRKKRQLIDDALASALAQCDLLLPNAHREAEATRRLLEERGYPVPRMEVVWNAFDDELFGSARPLPWRRRRPWIVSIGRVEAAKNVVTLAEAFREFRKRRPGAKLLVIGLIAREYFHRNLDRLVGPGVEFWGPIPHADVPDVLARARVHVLLGIHETPGLSSLEAAAMGCSVVVSSAAYGTMREYFGDMAVEVDPFDARSVAEGLERAWEGPPPELREAVWERFSASKVAAKLAGIYNRHCDGR